MKGYPSLGVFVRVATAKSEAVNYNSAYQKVRLRSSQRKLCLMLSHSLDIISNIQDGDCLCLKAVILNDFQALLLKFKTKLHQTTTIFEILYP